MNKKTLKKLEKPPSDNINLYVPGFTSPPPWVMVLRSPLLSSPLWLVTPVVVTRSSPLWPPVHPLWLSLASPVVIARLFLWFSFAPLWL